MPPPADQAATSLDFEALAERAARTPWEGPVAAGLLLAALVFGGASQENALQVGFLELAGLVVLVVTAVLVRQRPPVTATIPLWILAAIALIPLLQLIPLPPALWTALPGRADLARDLRTAGLADGWRPISVAPDLTLRSMLALIPPTAVFLVALRSSLRARRTITLGLVAFALVSVVLGLLQVAQGSDSALRFYARTNVDAGVGFFSNRNHFALLLVIAIPLVSALAADVSEAGRSAGVRRLAVAAALGAYIVLIVGVGASHSRAAVLLSAPAMVGGFLILFARSRQAARRPLALLFGAASLVGIALVIAFGFPGVAERFSHAPETEVRWQTAPVVAEAGAAYAPFGAGVGAFDPAYRSVEPTQLLGAEYLNHAHDDFLEIWLEAGFLGVGLIAAAVAWLGWAAFRSWRWPIAPGGLERAASLVAGLIVLASVVDYPLRTLAQASVFAFVCAMLAAPTIPRPAPQDSPGPRLGPLNVTPRTTFQP